MRTWLRSRRASVTAFFALTWVLGGLWAVATPIMGAPDEPGHVIRAASVVRGQIVGSPEVEWQGKLVDRARVPEPFGSAEPPCFAFTGTPACDRGPYGSGDVLVDVQNPYATYNPTYYALVGIPTLIESNRSTVYAMRLVTALLVASLVTLALVAILELRPVAWGIVGLTVAMTPMTLSLAGSVNPSAIETTAGLALWATLIAWSLSPDPSLHRSRAIRVAVAGVALVSTRALAPLFAGVIVAGAVLIAWRGGRSRPWAAISKPVVLGAVAVGLATVAATAWTLAAGTLSATGTHYPQYENPRRFLYDVVLRLDDYERQMIAVFGWLDTPAQTHVYSAWFALLGFLVLAALALGSTRERIVLLVLIALSAVLPVVLQYPVAPELGLIWQGRYLLPIMVGLPLLSGAILARNVGWNAIMSRPWALLPPMTVVACVQVGCYWWALHRNVIGLDEAWIGFEPLWQPPLGWIPLTIGYAVAVAAWVGTLAALARPEVGSVQSAA